MKKNDVIKLSVTDISEDGSGIGRYNNMVVFCRGMLPSEVGEVKIIKVTKSYCIGKLLNLEKVSAQRIEPPCCENFVKGCGGCTFCHLSYQAQLKYKEQRVSDCIQRIGGFGDISIVTKPIIPSEFTQGYRNKSIYPFAEANGVICGFYAPASHRVIPISPSDVCGLENSLSAKIRQFTTEFAIKNNISVYNEETGKGFLRALMIRTNSTATKAMAVIIINCKNIPDWANLYAAELTAEIGGVNSVYVCLNTKNTNVVLSGDMHLLLGEETIIDSIGDFDKAPSFEISPLSFYQVNPAQTALLYDAVYNALPTEIVNASQNTLIYDIYCGIGTIGLYLLSRLNNPRFSLVGVEYVSSAVENAKKNAAYNGFSSQAEFLCGDASLVTPTVISKYGKPSLIVLDPPRKGCDASLIETVLSAEADCIIYVSCNPSTLARDMKLLCADKYVCTSIQPVDMFPQSSHVETVILLSRKTPDAIIEIDLEMSELDLTRAESKATYKEIEEYVQNKYGLHVTNLYIAQVKREFGIIERINYNVGDGKSRVPQVTPEKREAIIDALKYFQMI